MHVCAIRHAKGQPQGTMLMICTVLACNLTMRLTLVSILQVFAVLRGYCHTPVARPRRNWTSCAQRSPAAAPGPPLEFTGVRPAHATDGLVK